MNINYCSEEEEKINNKKFFNNNEKKSIFSSKKSENNSMKEKNKENEEVENLQTKLSSENPVIYDFMQNINLFKNFIKINEEFN